MIRNLFNFSKFRRAAVIITLVGLTLPSLGICQQLPTAADTLISQLEHAGQVTTRQMFQDLRLTFQIGATLPTVANLALDRSWSCVGAQQVTSISTLTGARNVIFMAFNDRGALRFVRHGAEYRNCGMYGASTSTACHAEGTPNYTFDANRRFSGQVNSFTPLGMRGARGNEMLLNYHRIFVKSIARPNGQNFLAVEETTSIRRLPNETLDSAISDPSRGARVYYICH